MTKFRVHFSFSLGLGERNGGSLIVKARVGFMD